MADLVAAIDQGTTSTRCILFDRAGTSVSSHQIEHDQIMPRAGWVEHDPLQIWQRTETVVQQSMAAGGVSAADIAAVGITNQRETTIVWNRRTGQPYHNAIVWQDTRTAQLVGDLDRAGPGRPDPGTGRHPAGHLLRRRQARLAAGRGGRSPGGGRSRRRAVRHHRHLAAVEPDRRHRRRPPPDRRDQRQPDHADEPGRAAAGTTSCWSCSTSRGRCCREIVPSSHAEKFGTTRDRVRRRGGHRRGARRPARRDGRPGVPGRGRRQEHVRDRQLPADEHRDRDRPLRPTGLLSTVCYQFGDEPARYALEGSIAVTGSAIQWLRDQLGIVSSAAEADRLARRCRTPVGSTSCRRSRGCSRPTGGRTPAAPSSG